MAVISSISYVIGMDNSCFSMKTGGSLDRDLYLLHQNGLIECEIIILVRKESIIFGRDLHFLYYTN